MAAKIAVEESMKGKGKASNGHESVPHGSSDDWGFGGDEVKTSEAGPAVGVANDASNSADEDLLGWQVTIGRTDLQPEGANPKGNKIKTSVYTWYNFIPLNLYFQFHRFANWFFLIMSLINFVPQVRTFAPTLSFLPLVLVLIAQAIIDIVEDRRRHKSDYEINNKDAATMDLQSGAATTTKWADVKVGDIIRLEAGDAIPADLLLLHTSDPSGVAFVDTSNLDGETNLKARSLFYERPDLGSSAPPPFAPARFLKAVQCDQPSVKIYSFNGFIEHENHRVVLSAENLLLRDCILRNTDEVYGVVVYAGHQTKAMLNNTGPRHKVTKLEKRMNRAVIFCVALLILMSLIGAILSNVDQTQYDLNFVVFESWRFESEDYNPSLDSFERFWTWVVILQALVPLALYVSVVYVKFFQVFFVNSDIELYDPLTNTPMNCRALNLTEDLGQIQHVFSDKTGTLTQNVMMFRCCSIGGIPYRHGFAGLSEFDPNARTIKTDEALDRALYGPKPPYEASWDDVDPESTEHLAMMCLTLCNTARPSVDDALADTARDLSSKHVFVPGELHYEAESPDEVALLDAALAYGYVFCYTDIYTKHIRVGQTARSFRILATLEFDATRKCMSVVVELDEDTVRLYCKGADSAIFQRLRKKDRVASATEKHVDEFAAAGLRTLCLGYRDMPRVEFDRWLARWDQARSSMIDREANTEAVVAELEVDLQMIGTTGVEDALQAGVPHTIESLRQGGMNVWVVTGDKQETAIQIAKTCKLFSGQDQMLLLNSSLAKQAEKVSIDLLIKHEEECKKEAATLIKDLAATIDSDPSASWVLVVDGPTLAYCLSEENLPPFVEMSVKCRAAVICRATPFQKAQVVAAVKQECDVMTLAIGDGANDCSMIQMAHVGIGISGREGRQAVMASDFAIAQFRFLHRLLFVHGTWNYERVALLLQYFFFKNVMFNVVAYLFGFASWWSGTIFMDQLLFLLYNFFFTSLPQIYAAVYDRPVSADILMNVPSLYTRGRLDQGYNDRLFFAAVLEGIVSGIIVFMIPYGAVNGSEASMLVFGQGPLTLLILVGNTYTLLNSWNLDRLQWLCQFLSMGAYLLFNGSYYSVAWVQFLEETLGLTPSPLGVFTHSWGRPWFWGTIVVGYSITTLGRLFAMTVKRYFWPSEIQYAREKEAQGYKAVPEDGFPGLGSPNVFSPTNIPQSRSSSQASYNGPLKQNTAL